MALLCEPAPRALTEAGPAARLGPFVETVFACLPRADQRKWAELYIRALLLTPGKKSLRRLAQSVTDSPTAPQAIHQFVNASPWDWLAARQALLRWTEDLPRTPAAWTLAPAFIPKRGTQSAGVHRRFHPARGRITNCQLGIALLAHSPHGPLPVDWHLHIPPEWASDSPLRRKARIPDEACGPLWAQAAQLLHRAAAWSAHRRIPVTAELSWLPGHEPFLAHLTHRGQPFLVEVPDTTRVRPAAPLTAHTRTVLVRDLMASHGTADVEKRQHLLTWTVTLPGHAPEHAPLRLLAQHRSEGAPRTWLTNLDDRPLPDLLPLMQQPRQATAVIDSLGEDYGLLDFEGRSFPGWHHHTTLLSAAYTYARTHGRPR
ncbi:transposase [Streptomyces sp. NPDC013455]|uniref:IS701 family transposase n=1 Tax=Streptomyces sp. NPDC013455 TaxID=3155605 RepID=UPI0034109928